MKRAILQDILKKCHHQLQLGTHPQKDNFIHWTFLVKDGRIISSGVNRPVEPPRHFGYHTEICREAPPFPAKNCSSPHVPKLHSELDACRKAKGNAWGCTAVNVRFNKAGEMRMSMPCSVCYRLLYAMGVKKVFFSTHLGWADMPVNI